MTFLLLYLDVLEISSSFLFFFLFNSNCSHFLLFLPSLLQLFFFIGSFPKMTLFSLLVSFSFFNEFHFCIDMVGWMDGKHTSYNSNFRTEFISKWFLIFGAAFDCGTVQKHSSDFSMKLFLVKKIPFIFDNNFFLEQLNLLDILFHYNINEDSNKSWFHWVHENTKVIAISGICFTILCTWHSCWIFLIMLNRFFEAMYIYTYSCFS